MATPLSSLFALDPNAFGVAKSAGTFKRVTETNNRLSGLNAEEILSGLTPPPENPNIPEVTADAAKVQKLISEFPAFFDDLANQYVKQGSSFSITKDQAKSRMVRGVVTEKFLKEARDQDAQNYDNLKEQYRLQQLFQARKKEVESTVGEYNAQVEARKKAALAYNKQVTDYNTEKNKRISEVNASLIDPALISGEASASSGELLGATDLYSDNLHQLMLSRVGAANAEEEDAALNGTSGTPGSDRLSVLFARPSGA